MSTDLFVVWYWNTTDGWAEISSPLPYRKARKLWLEKTNGGTKQIAGEEDNYYKIMPNAQTRYSRGSKPIMVGLPCCIHGSTLIDHFGDVMETPCGCKFPSALR